MKPDNNAFAICGAIFFATLALVMCQSDIWPVRQLVVAALWCGALSQWIAQGSDRSLWWVASVFAYIAMFLTMLATISYYTW